MAEFYWKGINEALALVIMSHTFLSIPFGAMVSNGLLKEICYFLHVHDFFFPKFSPFFC